MADQERMEMEYAYLRTQQRENSPPKITMTEFLAVANQIREGGLQSLTLKQLTTWGRIQMEMQYARNQGTAEINSWNFSIYGLL